MTKCILSLDGGGIRGAASAQFLAHLDGRLQQEDGTTLRDYIDFYAGTSTGSVIALALATTDLSMKKISSLYDVDTAAKIFSEHRGWFDVDGLNAPKFAADGKTAVLKEQLGSARLGDVPDGKHVLAVSYGLEQRCPIIMKSTKEENRSLYAYQVADASSAAPTFFPTKEVSMPPEDDDFWLIDGGVIANNPTMCAIAEAKHAWKHEGVNVADLRVLSVGTGFMTRKINGPESRSWGALQWMVQGKIMQILSDERIVAYQAKTLLDEGHYIRVNAKLKTQPGLAAAPDDAMDDVSPSNIRRLKALGDYWYRIYGDAAIALLRGTYQGSSLDRIDSKTGKAIV